MGFGTTLVKYVLYILNILILICGILQITLGLIAISNMDDIKKFSEAHVFSIAPILFFALGCIIFVISFVGCFGAICKNTCTTMTYSVVMLILLVLQVFVVAYVWKNHNILIDEMNRFVNFAWEEHHIERQYMDDLEVGLKCCGKDSVEDYLNSGEAIPVACCGMVEAIICSEKTAYKPGCSTALEGFSMIMIGFIEYVGLAVAAVELIAFIFGSYMAIHFRNESRGAAC